MKIYLTTGSGLETVLEKTGRSLSDRFGIRVVCQGNQCATNGKTIFLPSLPDEMPPEMLQVIRGYLDHESAHICGKSNFRILKWFREKYGLQASLFLNMLEDLRVEEFMRQRFPGSGKNLAAAHSYLAGEALKDTEPMPVLRQLAFGVHARGNRLPDPLFVGPDVAQALDMVSDIVLKAPRCRNTKGTARLAEEAWPIVSQLFPPPPPASPAPGGAPDADQSQSGQGTAPGTPGAFAHNPDLADASSFDAQTGTDPSAEGGDDDSQKDAADIGSPSPQTPAQAGSSCPDQEQAGYDATDDSPGNTDGPSQPPRQANAVDDTEQDGAMDNAGAGDDDARKDEDGAIPSQPASAGPVQVDDDHDPGGTGAQAIQQDADENDGDEQDDTAADIMRALASSIVNMVNDYAHTTRAYRIWSTEFDTVKTAPLSSRIPHHLRMAKLLPHVAGIRQKLLQTLLAQPKARWLGDKENGSINPRALHRLAAPRSDNSGNDRVFRERVRTKRLHTAVTLLVDQSVSMNGKKIKLAGDTALVFCEALSRLDIPCSVVGFSTGEWDYYTDDTEAKTGMTFCQLRDSYRIAPLRHTYFKHFHESFRTVSGRFDSMRAMCVTPLGESILFAARELANRREERKVLFVVTDGRPEVGLYNDAPTFEHARNSIRRAERAGIDVALVGIMENCVEDLHHRSVVVNSLDELPKTVMCQLQSLLTSPA